MSERLGASTPEIFSILAGNYHIVAMAGLRWRLGTPNKEPCRTQDIYVFPTNGPLPLPDFMHIVSGLVLDVTEFSGSPSVREEIGRCVLGYDEFVEPNTDGRIVRQRTSVLLFSDGLSAFEALDADRTLLNDSP